MRLLGLEGMDLETATYVLPDPPLMGGENPVFSGRAAEGLVGPRPGDVRVERATPLQAAHAVPATVVPRRSDPGQHTRDLVGALPRECYGLHYAALPTCPPYPSRGHAEQFEEVERTQHGPEPAQRWRLAQEKTYETGSLRRYSSSAQVPRVTVRSCPATFRPLSPTVDVGIGGSATSRHCRLLRSTPSLAS